MILWSAPFRAHFPESVVLVDDGGDEVVRLVQTFDRKRKGVRVGGAAVGVMADRMLLRPRPDVSGEKNGSLFVKVIC